ncbi:hypothetical protein CB0940_10022 [Cercospora beticola]|uniref:Uncharacterized protein n=1 Tax=Cercospora beticola TaxID=122368 RepID=A0A2G5HHY5_CERBT|nr:hypothetical protein CB0940_10022 [Cercospora beticola]PIA91813.1 hypothetical protein CB0940_10022 [Cercospora beticola]
MEDLLITPWYSSPSVMSRANPKFFLCLPRSSTRPTDSLLPSPSILSIPYIPAQPSSPHKSPALLCHLAIPAPMNSSFHCSRPCASRISTSLLSSTLALQPLRVDMSRRIFCHDM